MKRKGRILAFFLVVLLLVGVIGSTTGGITKGISLGLDLQGGFEVLYEVEAIQEDQEVTNQMLDAVVQSLYQRVDILGVNEPVIDIEGDNRVRVQLAGVSDQNEAREILSTTANLTFRGVDDEFYFGGADLVEGSARQDFDQFNQPIVTLETERNFSNSEYQNFEELTREVSQKPAPENVIVIWLDYEEGDSYAEESTKDREDQKFISAPRVQNPIPGTNVMIEDGKIGPPVKGATLIGNGPDVLTKVTGIGNDMELDPGVGTCGKDGQGVPVGVGQPSLLVSAITVGGTAA